MRKWTWSRTSAAGLLTLIIVFEMAAFTLLAFRDSKEIDWVALGFGAILVAILVFQYMLLTSFFRHVDRFLLIIANFLVAVGAVAAAILIK